MKLTQLRAARKLSIDPTLYRKMEAGLHPEPLGIVLEDGMKCGEDYMLRRRRLGISTYEFCKIIGTAEENLHYMETGQRPPILLQKFWGF